MGRRLFFAGILVLFRAGRLAPGIGRINAAAGYADAKEFYESTEGQGSHIRVLDGDIYFATKGKEASYGGGLRYTAAGFDICIKGNGRQIELAVKRGGTLKEVAGAAVLAGGYWYNLYRITLADIYQMAAGKQDPAAVLESDSAEIVMNAILILRQGNVDLGSIAEDGCGNVTEQGTVFHLKEESQWQMIRRIFSGHTFESYRDIHLSASWKPYIHNVWYWAGEGNSVEKETAKVVQGEAVDLAVRAGKDGWTHIAGDVVCLHDGGDGSYVVCGVSKERCHKLRYGRLWAFGPRRDEGAIL